MTVYENMSFGLRLKRFPKDEIKKRVYEAAAHPRHHRAARPQAQASSPAASASASPWAAPSCAIPRCSCSTSRCRISTPSCACRCAPRSRSVHQKVRTTTVYVTHDQVEAMTLADRVVVMNDGIIEQVGTPNDLYHHPRTRFVAGFIGSPAMNFLLVPSRTKRYGDNGAAFGTARAAGARSTARSATVRASASR